MLNKTFDLDPILESLSLDKKSIKTILDFINLYRDTENKEILNSLFSDILNN